MGAPLFCAKGKARTWKIRTGLIGSLKSRYRCILQNPERICIDGHSELPALPIIQLCEAETHEYFLLCFNLLVS